MVARIDRIARARWNLLPCTLRKSTKRSKGCRLPVKYSHRTSSHESQSSTLYNVLSVPALIYGNPSHTLLYSYSTVHHLQAPSTVNQTRIKTNQNANVNSKESQCGNGGASSALGAFPSRSCWERGTGNGERERSALPPITITACCGNPSPPGTSLSPFSLSLLGGWPAPFSLLPHFPPLLLLPTLISSIRSISHHILHNGHL